MHSSCMAVVEWEMFLSTNPTASSMTTDKNIYTPTYTTDTRTHVQLYWLNSLLVCVYRLRSQFLGSVTIYLRVYVLTYGKHIYPRPDPGEFYLRDISQRKRSAVSDRESGRWESNFRKKILMS